MFEKGPDSEEFKECTAGARMSIQLKGLEGLDRTGMIKGASKDSSWAGITEHPQYMAQVEGEEGGHTAVQVPPYFQALQPVPALLRLPALDDLASSNPIFVGHEDHTRTCPPYGLIGITHE